MCLWVMVHLYFCLIKNNIKKPNGKTLILYTVKKEKKERKEEDRRKRQVGLSHFLRYMFTTSPPAWFLPFPKITHILENHILELNISIFLETEKAES